MKASPSVFSYKTLAPEVLAKLPAYPATGNPWQTGRNMNSGIPAPEWDALNAVLGPTKKVNLIIVRLASADESRDLEAAWVGGKKNDLVLTYGEGWARVFGWTDSSLVKRNLEGLLVDHKVDRSILPLIRDEVTRNYTKTDWHKFDYLDLQPRPRHYAMLVGFQILFGTASFWMLLTNGLTKGARAGAAWMRSPHFGGRGRRW